jgi:hypothetical protein
MTSMHVRRVFSLCAPMLAAAIGIAGAEPPPGSPPARPKVGLALGGGSAKGLAHIGVLRWFEEHRIPIDVVSGTSMGGLVGGAYATGMAPAELASMMKATDWDLMFLADSPFKYKTFRRKQDKRAYPSQIEFGLKHGFNRFSLGDPMRMSAYNNGELRGASYLFAAGGYLVRTGRLPDIIGGNVYIGGWLEGGSAFDKWDAAKWRGDGAVGLILETLVGPVFARGGVGFDGNSRFYIGIGPLFR